MKYEIGQKVKIREDLQEFVRYSGKDGTISNVATREMAEMKGKWVTIQSYSGNQYKVVEDFCNFNWTDEMFEDHDLKSRLENGLIVELKTGERRIYLNGYLMSPVDNCSINIESYDKNLYFNGSEKDKWSIENIYKSTADTIFGLMEDESAYETIWSRLGKTREMTLKEIEDLLGYKIKIIEEKKEKK